MWKALLLSCVVLFASAAAAEAPATGRIGIVLLHGKLGNPFGMASGTRAPIGGQLVARLRRAGYRVAVPEMCWSRARSFDRTYTGCFADVDAAIAELKAQGATAIVVGGLSLGGNAAIAYGATHPGLLGVIGLSPADDPALKAANNSGFRDSLARARRLVAQGQADAKTTFDDANTGPDGTYAMTLYTTPRIFLSFFDSDSLANLPASVAKLTVPLLWVAGDDDPSQRSGRTYAFDKAPANPLNRYAVVHATHLDVPDAAVPVVLAWLAALRK